MILAQQVLVQPQDQGSYYCRDNPSQMIHILPGQIHFPYQLEQALNTCVVDDDTRLNRTPIG